MEIFTEKYVRAVFSLEWKGSVSVTFTFDAPLPKLGTSFPRMYGVRLGFVNEKRSVET